MAAKKSTHSRKGWKLKWHGRSRDPLWNRWRRMIQRCHGGQSASAIYVGRGISVCQRWRDSYEAFVEDMGQPPTPAHQLERIDNNGNYEPGNVRWASPKENSRNRRVNVFFTIIGTRKTLAEWTEHAAVSASAVRDRLSKGWGIEDALFTPPFHFGIGRYAKSPLHKTCTVSDLSETWAKTMFPAVVQEDGKTKWEDDIPKDAAPIRLPYPASADSQDLPGSR